MVIPRRWQTETGLASGRPTGIRRGAPDPIEAARSDIAGSKHLIASVHDDIDQHYRWLESNRSAERKHRRRIKRQELFSAIEEESRRAAAFIARVAVRVSDLVRDAALFVWAQAAATFFILRDVLRRGAAWAAPYMRAAAMVAVIALVWLALELRAILLTLGRWLTGAWAWSQPRAHALAARSRVLARRAGDWAAARSAMLARQSRAWLARGAVRVDTALPDVHRLLFGPKTAIAAPVSAQSAAPASPSTRLIPLAPSPRRPPAAAAQETIPES